MNGDERRSPEELLRAIQKEESEESKGHLKIFLGMSAGVGKTYTMLEEARQLHSKGVDVVVGIVDTHKRHETALLLEGLKVIPEKTVEYKGKEFNELDIDSIIRLKPRIVLVDELAHNNIPGSRHEKRWQDVLEILDHGIDVYTTLNVQHIESLNDIIRRIVEISVRETVPDIVIEKAASIQLIDITPDELLERLKEGKIYLGDQSRIAPLHFFQKDKLTALREIALRFAADKVDRDLWSSLPSSEHRIQWKPREKVLAAVSHNPHSQKVIRTARRLAANIKAPWVAVHVNTGQTMDENETNQLRQNLHLAENLGAEVVTTNDPNIAEGIQRIARKKGITQIILGKAPRRIFVFLSKPTLLDRLSAECPDIDIHVIGQQSLNLLPKNIFAKLSNQFIRPTFQKAAPYILISLYMCLLTALNWALLPLIGYKITGFIFFVALLLFSLFFKKGPVILASLLYAFIGSFFFIPPVGQVSIGQKEDTALLALYVVTAIVNAILVDRARERKQIILKNGESAQFIYDIGQQIAKAPSIDEAFKITKEQLQKMFDCHIEILVKQIGNGLKVNDLMDPVEKNTALWSFEHGKEAGWSTADLPSANNLYIPLKGFHEVVGVLIFQSKTKKILSVEEKNYLHNICHQLGIVVEHAHLTNRP